MSKKRYLHVLNGDSTQFIFKKSDLEGDVVVWREVFTDGSFKGHISKIEFWSHRKKVFQSLYGIESKEYDLKTIQELNKAQGHYDEIIFWFEHDFFCQINMFGSLAYVKDNSKLSYDKSSLICVGEDMIGERKATLSDYSAKEYNELFNTRIHLNNFDVDFASQIFDAWIAQDPNEFYSILIPHDKFLFNEQTKICYLGLFKSLREEHSIFDHIVFDSTHETHRTIDDLVKSILLKTPEYGFGDMQIYTKLKNLSSQFKSFNPPILNRVLSNLKRKEFLGNVQRDLWFFDENQQKFFSSNT